jgi:nucleoside 2-deoxyribosyltransferase
MRKRFYVSSRKDRSAEADALSEKLQARGWERTYKWTAHDGEGTDAHAKAALEELEGVRKADVLIVLLPGGFGTHVEIGAALALGKSVILHSPDQETLEKPYPCVFHHHPSVKRLISETLELDVLLAHMSPDRK